MHKNSIHPETQQLLMPWNYVLFDTIKTACWPLKHCPTRQHDHHKRLDKAAAAAAKPGMHQQTAPDAAPGFTAEAAAKG